MGFACGWPLGLMFGAMLAQAQARIFRRGGDADRAVSAGGTTTSGSALASATEKHLGQSILVETARRRRLLGRCRWRPAVSRTATPSPRFDHVFRYPFHQQDYLRSLADLTYIMSRCYAFGVVCQNGFALATSRTFWRTPRPIRQVQLRQRPASAPRCI